MPARASPRSWRAGAVSSRGPRRWLPGAAAALCRTRIGLQRARRSLLRRLGELHRPGALLAGVDFKETGALKPASEAILDTADRELLVARAHEGFSGPLAAAIVVDRIDVIEARDKRATQNGLAGARGKIPPAFGGPYFA